MTVASQIEEVEHALVPQLVSYCQNSFQGIYLPSHDQTHHQRTWNYAKNLLLEFSGTLDISPSLIENMALAALLHDTGMVETLDREHGMAGRRKALEFLKNNNLDPERFESGLHAIEYHDDKDYTSGHDDPGEKPSLLRLLSLADDLDALGYAGVFRYYEIYTLRGIILQQLPTSVLDNLGNRFALMSEMLDNHARFKNAMNKRYQITRNFFLQLNAELQNDTLPDQKIAAEVIRCFEEYFRKPRYTAEESRRWFPWGEVSSEIGKFFRSFYDEFLKLSVI